MSRARIGSAPQSPDNEWFAMALAGMRFASLAAAAVAEMERLVGQAPNLDEAALAARAERAASIAQDVRIAAEGLTSMPAAMLAQRAICAAMWSAA